MRVTRLARLMVGSVTEGEVGWRRARDYTRRIRTPVIALATLTRSLSLKPHCFSRPLILAALLTGLLASPRSVPSDAAPPDFRPGENVQPGADGTQVRMLSGM